MSKISKIVYSTYLCLKYPFLKHYADRKKLIVKTCWYYSVDYGWRRIALQMFDDFKQELKRLKIPLKNFHIYDVKEKNGELDVNCDGFGDIFKIVEKYAYISYRTCNICGRQAYGISEGWELPLCEDCGNNRALIPFYLKDNKWYGCYKVTNKK